MTINQQHNCSLVKVIEGIVTKTVTTIQAISVHHEPLSFWIWFKLGCICVIYKTSLLFREKLSLAVSKILKLPGIQLQLQLAFSQ